MTREEAIKWLKGISTKKFGWDEYAMQESQAEIRERCEQCFREALDMAIEALQREDKLLKSLEANDPLFFTDVVRCKDCVYKEVDEDDEGTYYYCGLWSMPAAQWTVDNADFCSKGERRKP